MPLRMSSAERYLNCPASYKAQDGLPELIGDGSATSGHKVHAGAARLIEGLPLTEDMTAREIYIANWLADEWKKSTPFPGYGEEEIQIRHNGKVLWTGHDDRHLVMADKILLHEWKSGRNAVETAAGNAQLRLYAVALFMAHLRPVEAHLLAYGNEEGERHTIVKLSVITYFCVLEFGFALTGFRLSMTA